MGAVVEDIEIEQGTTWKRGWAVRVGATLGTLAPIDATWTAKAQIRTRPGTTGAPLGEFIASVDASGNAVICLTHTATVGWTWTKAYYDVEVTNAAQTVRLRVAEGQVTLNREVTLDA